MRDVGEGAAVDERGLTFERLDEVRLQRVLEQHRHRAGRAELLGEDGLAVERVGDRDRAEPLPEIVQIARHRDNRHHFGRGGDVEARLAHVAVRAAADADDDVAERAVVDVDAAPPADRERVDPEHVPVQEVRLEHRGKEVVCGADRMDVAGEVQVQILHRDDLRVAAAGRTALDPEHGPSDASRRQSTGLQPMCPRPCVRETEVVVLPSPAFVGVIAVTQIELSVGGVRAAGSRTERSIFAFVRPYGSTSCGSSPAAAAISSIGGGSRSARSRGSRASPSASAQPNGVRPRRGAVRTRGSRRSRRSARSRARAPRRR